MKITDQDYQRLKGLIWPLKYDIPKYRAQFSANSKIKDIEMAVRWELWHNTYKSNPVFINGLYEYLNDNHIDSALRQIIKELESTERAELEKEYLIQQAKIEFNG